MAIMLTRVQVDDYDAWKEMFDSARHTIRASASGHRIARSVENPNEVFIQVEFPSAEDALTAREKLLAAGGPASATIQNGPTLVEVAESVEY